MNSGIFLTRRDKTLEVAGTKLVSDLSSHCGGFFADGLEDKGEDAMGSDQENFKWRWFESI